MLVFSYFTNPNPIFFIVVKPSPFPDFKVFVFITLFSKVHVNLFWLRF